MARLGIVAALPQEFERIGSSFNRRHVDSIGPRAFQHCAHGDTDLVLVISHMGKVAAATTATLLIDRFAVDAIIVTGVAGGVGVGVGVGDLVLADSVIQHDFDLKGVLGFERFVIPTLGVARVATCQRLMRAAGQAARVAVGDAEYRAAVASLAARQPKLHSGAIGSGDQFINDPGHRTEMLAKIPELMAVEMEGAAVGQVCAEHGVPFVVARVVSDTAHGDAPSDFNLFIERAAAVASQVFVREFVAEISLTGI
jgi:adenosylhomocysteine nucleosidase